MSAFEVYDIKKKNTKRYYKAKNILFRSVGFAAWLVLKDIQDLRQNRSLNKLVRENAMTDERMDVARSGLWAADQLGFFLCFIWTNLFHYPLEAPQWEKIIKYFHSKSKRVKAICIKSE